MQVDDLVKHFLTEQIGVILGAVIFISIFYGLHRAYRFSVPAQKSGVKKKFGSLDNRLTKFSLPTRQGYIISIERREHMSYSGTVTCSYCYKQGHNRRKCPELTEAIKNQYIGHTLNAKESREGKINDAEWYESRAELKRQKYMKRTKIDLATGEKVTNKAAKAARKEGPVWLLWQTRTRAVPVQPSRLTSRFLLKKRAACVSRAGDCPRVRHRAGFDAPDPFNWIRY